jgi:hypothetical protein
MQAILLTSSLLIVLAMVGSLMALAAVRMRPERDVVEIEPRDDRL